MPLENDEALKRELEEKEGVIANIAIELTVHGARTELASRPFRGPPQPPGSAGDNDYGHPLGSIYQID